jgi:hypothetical protein
MPSSSESLGHSASAGHSRRLGPHPVSLPGARSGMRPSCPRVERRSDDSGRGQASARSTALSASANARGSPR